MPAIKYAGANLDGVLYEVDLDYRDYAADLAKRALRADAVWCGLSMHHFDTAAKFRVMREIRALIAPGGIFVLYEPTVADGKTRADYMRRIGPYFLSEWVIPTPIDQYPCAHSRRPMDMMRQSCSVSLFQASQQWSTMSSWEVKTRSGSPLSRMNRQRFSTGSSSGERGGNGTRVMLSGTSGLLDMCQPA
jgi:SAM-dependent methyltransferase